VASSLIELAALPNQFYPRVKTLFDRCHKIGRIAINARRCGPPVILPRVFFVQETNTNKIVST
jgi:hypothetical protein